MPRKRRVAILISGRGSNMLSLIEAARDPDYPAEIVGVLSNRPEATGLSRARDAGVAVHCIDHKAYADRETFERDFDAALARHEPDILCLAGFMRMLTPWLIERWQARMINIHPSLLPLFKGLHTHRRALEAGMRIHGCSVHYVVPELDSGPIIAQAAVPVLPGDTEDTLSARVLRQEHVLYPLALRLVASGRVRLQDGRVELDADWDEKAALVSPSAACSKG
jgi:phosphoribosylglycinamide formyltransferase 1